MQELIQKLMQQAHLSEAQAQNVLNVALNFVRTHIPALAPYIGMLGGGTSSASPSSSGTNMGGATSSGSGSGGILGDIEGALGGSSASGSGGGGIMGNIGGALGGLMGSGGQSQQLHQELVQKAGVSESQAANSVNVIKGFISQHVPGAASLTQEGSTLDNVEDKVDSIFGINDNPANK